MTMQQIFGYIQSLIHYDYTNVLFWYKIFAGLVSVGFVVGVAYAVWRTQEVFAALRGVHGLVPLTPEPEKPTSASSPSQRNVMIWEDMQKRASSDDENERKITIVSADSLMDKILSLSGYQGENLGSRLKQIEPSDLDSLQDLWEAHKVRNRIAHEPDLHLSREEATRTLGRYEKALKELKYL